MRKKISKSWKRKKHPAWTCHRVIFTEYTHRGSSSFKYPSSHRCKRCQNLSLCKALKQPKRKSSPPPSFLSQQGRAGRIHRTSGVNGNPNRPIAYAGGNYFATCGRGLGLRGGDNRGSGERERTKVQRMFLLCCPFTTS